METRVSKNDTSAELRAVRDLIRKKAYPKAFAAAQDLATKGVRDGQVLLGWMYQTGNGVECDLDEAERWYLKAVGPGYADAQFYLGALHKRRRDYSKAIEWFEKSSANGYPAAPYEIGRMYLFGEGVKANRETAFKYFEDADSRGHLFAKRNIAREKMSGRRGLRQIPVGILGMISGLWALVRLAAKESDHQRLLRL